MWTNSGTNDLISPRQNSPASDNTNNGSSNHPSKWFKFSEQPNHRAAQTPVIYYLPNSNTKLGVKPSLTSSTARTKQRITLAHSQHIREIEKRREIGSADQQARLADQQGQKESRAIGERGRRGERDKDKEGSQPWALTSGSKLKPGKAPPARVTHWTPARLRQSWAWA
jgi:hypothetical protein